MNKNYIIVLRSSGTMYNDELEKVLKNMHYEVFLTFPYFKNQAFVLETNKSS